MSVKIAADENIPFINEACRGLGEVITMPGREMTSERIKDADCLFVRSVTKVNKNLLSATKIKFVGTATIGIDHIDCGYLSDNGIDFTSAPGSNANSVAQYVISALINIEEKYSLELKSMALGIVGVGNVGKLVAKKAKALGMKIIMNDPLREEVEGKRAFSELAELLAESDIVTTHVPLEKTGKYPTCKLANETFFRQMKKGSFYINTSRGKVCDENALLKALNSKVIKDAVLDVWEKEPEINRDIFTKIFLGTPHIAGYSLDGKVNGTKIIVNKARDFFAVSEKWDPNPVLPAPKVKKIQLDGSCCCRENIRKAVLAVYDIRNDDKNMRPVLNLEKNKIKTLFDKLRKTYPRRREFFNTVIEIKNNCLELEKTLSGLGFKIS